ncbi:Mrr restriction system protein [Desulfovibrio sp. PG-178-WT-4]|uniref:Mrr restriction system protein n=1 Tax=Desulfovibrio porci TaxID=2605782 RepID=A0A6L5XMS6_9BACT|nr:restriction endonuclease [Desulfovibrio porci]MSS28498.1 Mrr restriction system protein [Desulfovibrio porci]
MAQITNKRLGELIQALFRILEKHPDGMKAQEALAALADAVTLTEYEAGSYESGRRFEKIVRFATVDTVRAGWLIKEGGIWTLTQEGAQALKLYEDPLEFHKKAAQLYQQWRKHYKGVQSDAQAPIVTDVEEVEDESEKSVSVSYEEAKEQAQEKIDTFLHAMDAYDFQKLVADLLRAIGYHVTWIAPPGKDGGVDILAYTDPLGTQGPRIKVQVKQQQKAVTEPDLKSFMANIGQHDSGIFFCTGGFTKDAETYARSQESKRIMLIDSAKLVQLWTDNIPRLSDQAWQRLPLTPIYFLTPEG